MKRTLLMIALLSLPLRAGMAQTAENTPKSDVFLQGFYWNSNPGGIWWDSLAGLAPRLGAAGFGAIWFPSPVKGQGGGFSMGYDPYDHYDFGQYNQKGSVETRFGSRQELVDAIAAYHAVGMQVFADAVMGHMNGGEALVPVDCEPYPSYPDSAYLLFNYPNGSGRFRKNARNFYPNQITCDVNPPYHGPYDPIFKFGEVPAHDQTAVRDSFIVWGQYLRNVMKFDGFRLDAVKHIDPAFVGPWLQSVGGYAVAEYFGNTAEIGGWLNDCQNVHGGDVSMFDFPLRFALQEMCNNTGGTYDMTWLDGAGLVSAGIAGYDVATFVENHDFDRIGWDDSIDNGHNPVISDKDMAYGYILFSEGRPSVFFRDYFTYGLAPTIDRLIWIREKFLWGGTTERGGLNPWYVGSTASQAEQARDIFVARRNGGNGRPQAFLVMNDHPTEWRGVWVNSSHPNQVFRDYTGAAVDKQAAADGRVELWAPPRGIAVYVPDTTQRVNHHPYLNFVPDLTGYVNTPFQYQVTAGDLNGDTLSFAVSGNPGWLSISPSGLLTGTPGTGDTAGVSAVIVTVADPWGGSSADTFTVSVRSVPLIDGEFEGTAVWGAALYVADTLIGWDGVRVSEIYLTEDESYYYLGAKVRARQWTNWAFLANSRSGGGSNESWSRNITYQHTSKPDHILRGHFQGYAEFHTWNGSGWSGVGTSIPSTEYAENLTLDSLQDGWIEGRIAKSVIGDRPALAVQFYLTGQSNGNATFDACPDDQNTTAWTGSPTALRYYAFYGEPALSEVNLQFPPSATIAGGGSATVYARTFGLGITDTAGAGAGVSAWIGVSPANTDPATWSNWIPAVYNTDYAGADEYQAAIGADLAGGVYSYASRFQHDGGPFLYGGYSSNGGGWWNGTTFVSGQLTVQAAPAVPALASPSDGSLYIAPNAVLHWNAVAGLNTYRLQVAQDSLFAAIVLDDSTITGTARQMAGLSYGAVHYWRVGAKNAFGSSGFSPAWSFTVFVPETAAVALAADWNLVSVPLTVEDGRRSVLFPGAASGAFAFHPVGGYTVRDTMTPGAGYWLKYPAAGVAEIVGGTRPTDTLHLLAGWNLVGSLSVPAAVAGVVQIPDSILRSLFYSYNGAYGAVDSLRPGSGYWVKSASAGALLVTGGGALERTPMRRDPLTAFGRLTIEDAAERRQVLYLGSAKRKDFDGAMYEMPPVPPAGVFDARFASQRLAEAAEAGEVLPLQISSAVYPLTVRFSAGEDARSAVLTVGGRAEGLTSGGSVTVTDPAARLGVAVAEEDDLPTAFALEQNYPNPFNPTTSIMFTVPASVGTSRQGGTVSLQIFDVLGRGVATLVNEVKEPGTYTVTFPATSGSASGGDASALSSGVYFYRLTAGAVVMQKKMMLVR